MARPTKYEPELVKRVCDAIRLGATYQLACHYGGISYQTFCEWRNAKQEFSDAVKAAEGQAAVGWLAKIEVAASDGNWQAAAWKLERRYPDSYGKTRIAIEHDEGDATRSLSIEEVLSGRNGSSNGDGVDSILRRAGRR